MPGGYWCLVSNWVKVAAPASVFVNRNFFAEYLVCTLPFSAYALTQLRSPKGRALMALSLAWNLAALLMTGTRSALVATAIMVPVTLVVRLTSASVPPSVSDPDAVTVAAVKRLIADNLASLPGLAEIAHGTWEGLLASEAVSYSGQVDGWGCLSQG